MKKNCQCHYKNAYSIGRIHFTESLVEAPGRSSASVSGTGRETVLISLGFAAKYSANVG